MGKNKKPRGPRDRSKEKYVACPETRAKDKAKRRTIGGAVRTLYNNQKRSCIKRSMPPPDYTLVQFREWLMANGYETLYNNWVAGGFQKPQVPSVDRLDPSRGYSFDNIRLVTWQENCSKVGLDHYRKPPVTNKTGVSGVSKHVRTDYRRDRPWEVVFRIKGKKYYLGCYATLEEAIAVRVKWMEEHQQEHYPDL